MGGLFKTAPYKEIHFVTQRLYVVYLIMLKAELKLNKAFSALVYYIRKLGVVSRQQSITQQ